jgi:histidine triad (HIT) family protein
MPSADCLFCKIVAGSISSYKIYEDEKVYAFLDIYPQSLGHTLIIPKKHSKNILDIDVEDLVATNQVAQKLAKAYQTILGADGFVLKSHHNKIAGQEVDHFHLHLLPKYQDNSKNQDSQNKKALEQLAQTIASQLT